MSELNLKSSHVVDTRLEAAVVAAILLDATPLPTLRQLLPVPEMFTDERHQVVYRTMLELHDARKVVNGQMLLSRLEATKRLPDAGGKEYLREIASNLEVHGWELYAGQVREAWERRQVMISCMKLTKMAREHEGPSAEVVQEFQSEAARLSDVGRVAMARRIGDGIVEWLQEEEKGDHRGISTGFDTLDAMTGGFGPSQLWTLAGHSKHGKSTLAFNLALPSLLAGRPVVLFELEMELEQLRRQFLAMLAEVSYRQIRDGLLSPEQKAKVVRAAEQLAELPLHIEAMGSPKIGEITARARAYVQRFNPAMIIVDYYQLIGGDNDKERRYEQLVGVSRSLRLMANELRVPVLVLAQLNAQAALDDRLPTVNDIEQCKHIVKDSNVVVLMDWEFHRKKSDEAWRAGLSGDQHRNVWVSVAAIRHAQGGSTLLKFYPEYSRFYDENVAPISSQQSMFEQVSG